MQKLRSKWLVALALSALLAGCRSRQLDDDKSPARGYHDSEKDKAVQLALVGVGGKKTLWALRNGSDWYLSSVSFMCDDSESNDQKFVYTPADGALIAPWKDAKVAPGKQAPWGFLFPGDDEYVLHTTGVRQDVLDADAAEWYVRTQRVFNCRVTDVGLDHKQPPEKQIKKIIGGR